MDDNDFVDLIINGDHVKMKASLWNLLEKYVIMKNISIEVAFENIVREELNKHSELYSE